MIGHRTDIHPHTQTRLSKLSSIGLVIVLALNLSAFQCAATKTKNLAVASQAISHALLDAQQASQQAVQAGVITQADDSQFEILLSKAAQTGIILDQSIRAGASANSVAANVAVFLDAFNALNTSGVAGIKNPNLKLTISTILTGAQASIAVIAAAVGTGAPTSTQTTGGK